MTRHVSLVWNAAEVLARPRPGVLRWVVLELRPKQWTKNLFCFAGLVFSGQLFIAAAFTQAWVGFLAFCCASSCVYILNDVVDREKDRANPRTCHRPIASGEVSVHLALTTLLLLLGIALAASLWLGERAAIVVIAYLALNVFYSFRLKHTVIADVMCIALGFVFRVVYGVYAVQAIPTAWIVICIFFLAIFLGFAKRKSELASMGDEGGLARPVLNKYSEPYLDILLAMSATMAILCYSMFTVTSSRNPTLIVTVVPVAYCIMRYMLHVIVHGKGGSPETILLSDKMLWTAIAVWFLLCVAILYGEIHIIDEIGR